jgi:hypothetical protein
MKDGGFMQIFRMIRRILSENFDELIHRDFLCGAK